MKIFLFLILVSTIVQSKTPEEIAQRAMERTPQLIMNMEEMKSRSLGVNQSRLWKNPSISMQSGKARTGRDHAFVMDLTLMQPLPWPGTKEVLSGEARLMEDLAALDATLAEVKVYHAVLLMSIEYGYMEKLNQNNQTRRKRLNEIKNYFSKKSIVSENDKIEAGMINNQMLLVDNYIFEIRSKMNNLKSRIKRLADVDVDSVTMQFSLLTLPHKDLFMTSLMDSPEWKKQHKQLEIAKINVKKAEIETRPEVQVGLNYRVEHLRPENEFMHANLAVTIPIWDRGQYREEIARSQLRKEEAGQKLTEMNLLNQFEELYHLLEMSFHQTQNFDVKKIKKIEQEMKDVESAFRKGRITAAALLQYDNLMQETLSLTFKARYEYFKTLSDLNELIGRRTDLK